MRTSTRYRRVGRSDEPDKLNSVGRSHERPFLISRFGDAMLQPKPHGAIAVNPLPPRMAKAPIVVNGEATKSGGQRRAVVRLPGLSDCPWHNCTPPGLHADERDSSPHDQCSTGRTARAAAPGEGLLDQHEQGKRGNPQ